MKHCKDLNNEEEQQQEELQQDEEDEEAQITDIIMDLQTTQDNNNFNQDNNFREALHGPITREEFKLIIVEPEPEELNNISEEVVAEEAQHMVADLVSGSSQDQTNSHANGIVRQRNQAGGNNNNAQMRQRPTFQKTQH